MKTAFVSLLVAWPWFVACQGSGKAQKSDAPAAASAAAAPSGASSAAAPPSAWYAGSWQGSYKAELHRVELPAGGIKEWKKDDGVQASGDGKLSLDVAVDGGVTGKASGPLGEQTVSGRVEGARVALTLTPAETNGFQGVILAEQAPEGIKGALSASTGDSLVVRKATVLLAKAAK
jgi:hypothetical protein